MTIYSGPERADRRAVRNMRVTFWGVQGSCPVFPSPFGVREYSRRMALHTLGKAIEDMARRSRDGRISVEELLGGPPTRNNIENYQRRIGLPELPTYGGETTCVEVETSEGDLLIFDAGTGIRRCSLELVERWRDRIDRTIHLFGSHEHLDHRSGLSFARFCYLRDNPFNVHVYGSYTLLHALDRHYGLFSKRVTDTTYIDDPMDYSAMPANFKGYELRRGGENGARRRRFLDKLDVGKPIRIGNTTVTPFEVYHVIPMCLGYKVEHGGKRFVFCTDHENRRGPDPDEPRQVRSRLAEERLREMCRDADLAYFDGQYLEEEYLGNKGIGSFPATCRIDWGHGCVEDAVERARQCGIKRTLIGHHDPERPWPERNDLDRRLANLCKGEAFQIQLADGDSVVDL